jgi:hypothetical protein
MRYFLQSVSASVPRGTRTHSIVTAECGRVLLNEEHGDWCEETPDASSAPKVEISREEYKALHEKIFEHSSQNAREEFEGLVKNCTVLCAEIIHFPWEDGLETTISLKSGYGQEEYESFLDSLDFFYDSGFGAMYVAGTIWFQDGTWAIRKEYDGSEWWDHRILPEIPEHLR